MESEKHQEHACRPHTEAQAEESQGQGVGHRAESSTAESLRLRVEPHIPEPDVRLSLNEEGTDRLPATLPLPPPLPLQGRRGAILALALAAAGSAGASDFLGRGSPSSGSGLAAEAAVEGGASPGGGEAPGASVQSRILRGLGIGDPDVYYPRYASVMHFRLGPDGIPEAYLGLVS